VIQWASLTFSKQVNESGRRTFFDTSVPYLEVTSFTGEALVDPSWFVAPLAILMTTFLVKLEILQSERFICKRVGFKNKTEIVQLLLSVLVAVSSLINWLKP
jgi:hypothetical protein